MLKLREEFSCKARGEDAAVLRWKSKQVIASTLVRGPRRRIHQLLGAGRRGLKSIIRDNSSSSIPRAPRSATRRARRVDPAPPVPFLTSKHAISSVVAGRGLRQRFRFFTKEFSVDPQPSAPRLHGRPRRRAARVDRPRLAAKTRADGDLRTTKDKPPSRQPAETERQAEPLGGRSRVGSLASDSP